MNRDADEFSVYLVDHMPAQTSYVEAVRACRRIFCTLDGLPENIASLALDRHAISFAFAGWVRHHYEDSFVTWCGVTQESIVNSPLEPEHWSGVIDEVYVSRQSELDSPLPFK